MLDKTKFSVIIDVTEIGISSVQYCTIKKLYQPIEGCNRVHRAPNKMYVDCRAA